VYFYLIGIDYKRTPVNIREAVYWKRGDIAGFLAERSGGHAAAFHTCNRFEVYGTADDVHSARDFVRSFRKRFFPLFETGYAVYEETDVLRHIVRLASGVESQITGELQIYSQLGTWAGRKDTPAVLARLVHEALLATHALRYENGLNKPERNIAVSIYDSVLSKVRSDGLLNIAVVGTGSVAELFASYKPQGVRLVFAARRI
jgi:glutamyl-tRNA reductase